MRNYVYNEENNKTISRNPVNAIYEDAQKTLWVGTVEGGLNRKLRGSSCFSHYRQEDGILNHNSVSTITSDGKGHLWVGTWGDGINVLDINNPKNVISSFTVQNTGKLIEFVGILCNDTINDGMWIGANQGLYFYDYKTRQFTTPLAGISLTKVFGFVGSVIDREGHLWLGAIDGVYDVDLRSKKNGQFSYRHLQYKLDNQESKIKEKISCVYESKNGTLWLGSNGMGVYKRDISGENEVFTNYTVADGLVNDMVRGILEDDKGNIWVSTNNGLSCIAVNSGEIVNYTKQDGIVNTQFYWNAAYKSSDGLLYFGSTGGLVAIDSELPLVKRQPANLKFTNLMIGNQTVLAGSPYLDCDISSAQQMTMHEREKVFIVEFAALDFLSNHAGLSYSYRLLGFHSDWIEVTDKRRFATYTNIYPGTYRFQVRCVTAGSDLESIKELKVIVEPYFYKTVWFILSMLALLIVVIWMTYRWRIRSLKEQRQMLHTEVENRTHELKEQKKLLEEKTEELSTRNATLQEQNDKITRQKAQIAEMAQKVQELTYDKISFFTNITHEFRTPITLIMGPIQRALKLSSNPLVIEQLHFVERNSKYLLSLVNQLMDFRKVESGKMEIVRTQGDFKKLAEEIIAPFDIFANDRKIQIKRYYHMPVSEFVYDEEAMHKVLTNLLSNAIKFTPDGGEVSFYAAVIPNGTEHTLYINVSDTGSGIVEEDLEKVFDRFYQSKGQIKFPIFGSAGSGIGLYLCRCLVEMHGGKISAKNNAGRGCSMRMLLPIQIQCSENKVVKLNTQPSENQEITDIHGTKEYTLLIVEDNNDMRGYIRSILSERYDMYEAANGEEALSVLASHSVDMIISDLMMPVMDGLELSRKVKSNFAISHIPFLMLTAKTSPEARLESYRIGVDEYLLKPFDENLLLAKIESIFANLKRYQHRFSNNMDVESLNIEQESSDSKFMNQVMKVVKDNYKNSYFEVGDFCEAMGISKSLLNKKLQSLIGQSAGQLVRNYRLNISREYILKNRETKNMNITEIAYEVGFNDPKYFTRCFTKQFDITPSALLGEK